MKGDNWIPAATCAIFPSTGQRDIFPLIAENYESIPWIDFDPVARS